MTAPSRSGLSSLVAAAAGTVLVLAGVGAYVSNNIWNASRALNAAPAAKVSDTDANRQLRNLLVRAGLGPDSLAAAGVNGAKASEVVAAVRGVLTEQGAALKTADENHRASSILRQQIIAKVQPELPPSRTARPWPQPMRRSPRRARHEPACSTRPSPPPTRCFPRERCRP